MRAVNQLYAKFQADTEFHHKYQVIGSALHPGYVGTILVLSSNYVSTTDQPYVWRQQTAPGIWRHRETVPASNVGIPVGPPLVVAVLG